MDTMTEMTWRLADGTLTSEQPCRGVPACSVCHADPGEGCRLLVPAEYEVPASCETPNMHRMTLGAYCESCFPGSPKAERRSERRAIVREIIDRMWQNGPPRFYAGDWPDDMADRILDALDGPPTPDP